MIGKTILLALVVLTMCCSFADAQRVPIPRDPLVPNGVLCDRQTSLLYDPATGELAIDVATDELLEFVGILSEAGIIIPEQVENVGTFLDTVRTNELIKNSVGNDFGTFSFGRATPPGLTEEFILSDLIVTGMLHDDRPFEVSVIDPLFLGPVDLIYGPITNLDSCPAPAVLQAGDADQDLKFDQLDLVQVLVAAMFLTGQPATWGEGDWNGAPVANPGIHLSAMSSLTNLTSWLPFRRANS